MITALKRRLRRSWHHLRRRRGAGIESPQRLVVEKATWLNDARSPVMLMVDDLANAWHSGRGESRWEPGGDWGGGRRDDGSIFRFLEERLLRDYPEARVTFFTVAGTLAPYTRHQPFSHAAPMDADAESRAFFASLAEDPRFELAYHGYDHGTPGVQTEGFVQEWRGFPSLEAAVTQTTKGLQIFSRAAGAAPLGGKYGGWEYNGFAEEAVAACGFLWWCRDWMPRDVSGRISDGYYEPQFFGVGPVVALPATVHGHFWSRRQIDFLLARRQVISIEEHIAPVRPDGLIQTPNIVDDLEDLRRLYGYLRDRGVWHATGSAIASYVIARERSFIYDITTEGFSVRYDERVERPPLTLRIDATAICSHEMPAIEVVLPDGASVDPAAHRFDGAGFRFLVTLPVMRGRYRVQPRAS
jgi:hypothetical protein